MTDEVAPEIHDLLVRGGTIVDVTGTCRVDENFDIAIDGNRISAKGPTGTVGTGKRILEASGKAVLPGLVNCHTHSPMSLFRGTSDVTPLHQWLEWVRPFGNQYHEDDIYWGAMFATTQMIRAGVTTFADMYICQDVIAQAVDEVGIRAFLSEAVMMGDGSGLRGTVEAQLGRAERFALEWAGGANGRISTGVAPHSVYACDDGLLREVAQLARDAACGLHVHVSETGREVAECLERCGQRPPRVLEETGCFEGHVIAAHSVHVDADDIALYAERGVGVSHNPGSNLKLRAGLAPVPALMSKNVTIGLGTDSAGSNDSLDMWRDCFLAAVLHEWGDGVSTSWTVLEMATMGGAAVVGLEAEVGTLRVGYKADLALIDLARPNLAPGGDLVLTLLYAMRGDEVDSVVVDGKVVMAQGHLLTVDEEEVVRQSRQRAMRIFRGE